MADRDEVLEYGLLEVPEVGINLSFPNQSEKTDENGDETGDGGRYYDESKS